MLLLDVTHESSSSRNLPHAWETLVDWSNLCHRSHLRQIFAAFAKHDGVLALDEEHDTGAQLLGAEREVLSKHCYASNEERFTSAKKS